MGIVVRQSIKTTAVYFAGALLGALTTFAYAHMMSKPEQGYITIFVFQCALIQILTLMGTAALVGYYIQKFPEHDTRQKTLLSFSALVILGASLLFSIGYFAFKDNIIGLYQAEDREYISRYYWLTPFLIVCWSFMTFLDHYLIAKHKVAIAAFMREVAVRLLTIGFLALYYFGYFSFDQFVISIVISYLVPTFILLYVALRVKGFGFSLNFRVFSRAEYKDFIHFSWYHLLTSVTITFMGYIDILMIGPLDKNGIASLAVYRNVAFIISIMGMPVKSISNASFATVNRTFLEEDESSMQRVFNRVGDNILIAGTCMFALIACNLDNVVRIFPEGYDAIKPLVLILMIGRMMDVFTGMNNEVISISKYYKFNFRLSVLLVVCTVALMRYLIPIYGVYGAAWGATISLAAFNIVKALYLWRKLQLKPYTKATLRIFAAGAAACAAGFLLPYLQHVVPDVLVRSAVIIVVYLGASLALNTSQDLKDYISNLKKNKRLY